MVERAPKTAKRVVGDIASRPGESWLVSAGVPRLGVGLAALGRPGYINTNRRSDLAALRDRTPEAMKLNAWKVLDAAWAAGVRYFDCARSYGLSEQFLAGWLDARNIPCQTAVVGSKWGYRYTADWKIDTAGAPHEVKDHSLTHLEEQLVESKKLLGRHIRLYQIHSATIESRVLENTEVLDRLRQVRDLDGWRLGLSLSGTAQAATLEKALDTKLFDSVQATWNLFEQSAGDVLLKAHQAGLKVIIKEAMANGRLLTCDALIEAAAELDVAPDALALAAVMAQPFEPMVLSGAVTADQFQSNLGAIELADALRGEKAPVLQKLTQDLRCDADDYWKDRSALTWN